MKYRKKNKYIELMIWEGFTFTDSEDKWIKRISRGMSSDDHTTRSLAVKLTKQLSKCLEEINRNGYENKKLISFISLEKLNDKTPINSKGAECPYCGEVDRDIWETIPNQDDSKVIECDCGKYFEVTIGINVEYKSRPLGCENNLHEYSKYDWSKWFLSGQLKVEHSHQRFRDCINCNNGVEREYKTIEECPKDQHQWDDWSIWFSGLISHDMMKNLFRIRFCKYHPKKSDVERKNFSNEEVKRMKDRGDYDDN